MYKLIEQILDLGEKQAKNKSLTFLNKHYPELTQFTSGDLLEGALKILSILRTHGIKHGDRVFVIMDDHVTTIQMALCCFMSGIILVAGDPLVDRDLLHPTDPEVKREKHMEMIKFCQPKAIFLSVTRHNNLALSLQDLPANILIIDADKTSKAEYDQSIIDDLILQSKSITETELCWIFFTSGTTGKFSAVEVQYQQYYTTSRLYKGMAMFKTDKRILSILPFCHIMGVVISLDTILLGCEYFLIDPMKITTIAPTFKPQLFIGVPAIYHIIARKIAERAKQHVKTLPEKCFFAFLNVIERVSPHYANHLRRQHIYTKAAIFGPDIIHLISGSSFLDPETSRIFAKFGIPILNGWGLTETLGAFTCNQSNWQDLDTVGGKLLEDCEIKIKSVNPNGEGEILVKGPTVFKKYYNDPEKTAAAFEDGWFKTGDTGILVAGKLKIVGRSKHLIIKSGENVSPDEIVSIYMNKIPEIVEMAVHSKRISNNEITYGYIFPDLTIHDNTEELTSIIALKMNEVKVSDRFKVDEYQVVFKPFPKTSTAKIKLHEVIKMYGSDINHTVYAKNAARLAASTKKIDTINDKETDNELKEPLELLRSLLTSRYQIDTQNIQLGSFLNELGLGSPEMTDLVWQLEQKLNVQIQDTSGQNVETVKDLLLLLKNSKPAENTGRDPLPSRQDFVQIPKIGINTAAAQEERLVFLENMVGMLPFIRGQKELTPEELNGNCETFIGWWKHPLQISGPLFFKRGTHINQEFIYFPLATHEGTLAYSATRGSLIMNYCGGIETEFLEYSMVKAPLFRFNSFEQSQQFVSWCRDHMQGMEHAARLKPDGTLSNHIRLEEVQYIMGPGTDVILRIAVATGPAVGQNMATNATQAIINYIKEHSQLSIAEIFFDSGLSADKKPSVINGLNSRGCKVRAKVVLDDRVLKKFLNTTAFKFKRFTDNALSGCMLAGVSEYSAHQANAYAARFLAHGQDEASVHEASNTIFKYLLSEDSQQLEITAIASNLTVGTHGGFTRKGIANETLKIIGCYDLPEDQAKIRLAQIDLAVAMALEISIIGALESGEFAQAHFKYGRNV